MKRIMSLMRNFRQSIREIYLHSDGMTLEIVYDTQFWVFNFVKAIFRNIRENSKKMMSTNI